MNGRLFQHIASGNLYRVLFTGRIASEKCEKVVVYKQLYKSVLRGTRIKLYPGSVWVRPVKEFRVKFKAI